MAIRWAPMEAFGRYLLRERIGAGGMAEIYLARSASIDGFEKDLVIKRIRPDLSTQERFSSLFIDEARISIQLSHPNIVQVFDFGEAYGAYYLAMEYVHGCDLASLLALPAIADHGMEPPLALVLIGEVLKALDYAHNKSNKAGEPLYVVHRDISPHNVMISFEGGVKLTDFGIAKARGSATAIEPGMVVGKMGYMSPEQLLGDEVDSRTDLYACGVMLWEMLVGRSLFGEAIAAGELDRVAGADIRPPSRFRPDIHPELDALCMRALAHKREQRFPSACDFGNEVHAYLVKHHPSATIYHLQGFLKAYQAELRGQASGAAVDTGRGPSRDGHTVPLLPKGAAGPSGFEWSTDLVNEVESFQAAPNLWKLVRMAELCAAAKQPGAALACYRAAAGKFAQRGLLVQALYAARRMLELGPADAVRGEITALPALTGKPDAELIPAIISGKSELEDLLRALLDQAAPGREDLELHTPLLSHLGGEMFAELAALAPLTHHEEGEAIVEQGEVGRTMFLIVRGRVVVFVSTPEEQRLYLSALSGGDFFGENGFFSGAPRIATVEVLEPTYVFEVDRALYNRIAAGSPETSAILLAFYKERIVETTLARSPVFGQLDADDRRALVQKFTPRVFRDGEAAIAEGTTSDPIYIIKDGQADVVSERDGIRTHLSTLGAGTLFGEVAALRGIARTASVVAKGRLEVLELSAGDFLSILDERPEVKRRVHEVVAQRARDNMDRLMPGAAAPR
jgi:CRP-like cAMP-binding protein